MKAKWKPTPHWEHRPFYDDAVKASDASEKAFDVVAWVIIALAAFFTLVVYLRKHEEGIKSWTCFWIALGISWGITMATGNVGSKQPFIYLLKFPRFFVIWMYTTLFLGNAVLASVEKVTGATLHGEEDTRPEIPVER